MDATGQGLRSTVRLLTGLLSSEPATLTLIGTRLSLMRGGETLFELPVSELDRLLRPDLLQLRFGRGNLQVTANGTLYRLSFPAMTGFAGRTTGRQQAIQWEQEIRSAQ